MFGRTTAVLATASLFACTPGGLTTQLGTTTKGHGSGGIQRGHFNHVVDVGWNDRLGHDWKLVGVWNHRGPATSASASSSGGTSPTSGATSTTSGSTSATSGSTGSAAAVCLDGGPCCGWDWAARDATCPTSFAFLAGGASSRSLYAMNTEGIALVSPDGVHTPVSPGAGELFALFDAGYPFVVQSEGVLYEANAVGQYRFDSIGNQVFIAGMAASQTVLFFTTIHGAFAIDLSTLATLWSNQGGSWYPDLKQVLSANGALVAASPTVGAAVLSAATGSFCYTDLCVVPDGGPVAGVAANDLAGVAVDDRTGTSYLVGFLGAGGAIEALDSSGSCLFLHAAPRSCLGSGGPCNGACTEDPSLEGISLSAAAYASGALYAIGASTTEPTGTMLFIYTADAGLVSIAPDAGDYALAAGP